MRSTADPREVPIWVAPAEAGGVGMQGLTVDNVTAHDQHGVVGNGARPTLGVLSMVITNTFAGWCDGQSREPTQMAPATATGVDPARARAQPLPAVELLMNHRTLR